MEGSKGEGKSCHSERNKTMEKMEGTNADFVGKKATCQVNTHVQVNELMPMWLRQENPLLYRGIFGLLVLL